SSCSTCPCHRAAPNHPAGVPDRFGQPTVCHAAFTLPLRARPPEFVSCRGHHWVHLRCGPVTRSPSRGWLRRLAPSVSFPPRMRPKLRRFLTFPPAGLTPTEHVCLFWTHKGTKNRFGSCYTPIFMEQPAKAIAAFHYHCWRAGERLSCRSAVRRCEVN